MLFEMARALRSLTRSPITSALHEARRMARPHFHFKEGGIVPHEGRVDGQNDDGDFLLPADVDPMDVALAIDQKLRDGRTRSLGDDPMMLLERRAGGRIVVGGHHLLRLGDGDFAKGKQFMHGLVAQLRRH